jgi:hypothetical protein
MCRLSAVVGVALLLFANALHAADSAPASADDLKKTCEETVKKISRGESQGFYALLQETFRPLPDEKLEEVFRAHSRYLRSFGEEWGGFLDLEPVEETKVGNSLRRCVYVAKYEKSVIRWEFVLYRPREEWRLLSWNWSENLDSLFKK